MIIKSRQSENERIKKMESLEQELILEDFNDPMSEFLAK